jgi:hypothetical protein
MQTPHTAGALCPGKEASHGAVQQVVIPAHTEFVEDPPPRNWARVKTPSPKAAATSPSWVTRVMKGRPRRQWVSMKRGTKVQQGLPWHCYLARLLASCEAAAASSSAADAQRKEADPRWMTETLPTARQSLRMNRMSPRASVRLGGGRSVGALKGAGDCGQHAYRGSGTCIVGTCGAWRGAVAGAGGEGGVRCGAW